MPAPPGDRSGSDDGDSRIAQPSRFPCANPAVVSAAEQKLKTSLSFREPRIAVLIPCYNEQATIGAVVKGFYEAIPAATVYVYDNNSMDGTIAAAASAGALVRRQVLQGKGHVVRRMFSDIDADVYVLVDGDQTYDAAAAPAMIEKLLSENLDMVVGRRVDHEDDAYRTGHRFGNTMLTGAVSRLFGNRLTDILSGYRIFSKRFVKSVPILSKGFEIETELTVHALILQVPVAEIDTEYRSRPVGSSSKLHTFRDGARILMAIVRLLRTERPLLLFSILATVFLLVSFVLAIPIFITYYREGIVPRLPTAVLCTGLTVLSVLSWVAGLVLENVTRGQREVRLLAYLSLSGVNGLSGEPRENAAQPYQR